MLHRAETDAGLLGDPTEAEMDAAGAQKQARCRTQDMQWFAFLWLPRPSTVRPSHVTLRK
jgi:hypothetical protein